MIPSAFQNPRLVLGAVAMLVALIVQPGEPGSIDTTRRLQVTHSLWTSAPQVIPSDFPTFGIVGRDGRLYAWYGIGQSLLMLPPDILFTALIKTVPALHARDDLRGVLVSFTISPLICTLAVLACFRLLTGFGFTPRQSVAGSLALLFGTTFLHYTQNMMENNLLLLLMLLGLSLHYQWVRTGSRSALAAGSIASGAAILVRMTVALDIAAIAGFVAGALWLSGLKGKPLLAKLTEYVRICTPTYLVFLLADRAYHFYRFGQCCTNYIQLYGQQQRLLNPSLPANYPYTTPFWNGFLGAFVTPEKSVFLFDPLLIVAAAIAFALWKQLAPEIRSYLLSMFVLLLAGAAFHARLSFWSGDVAWGDRYLTTSVQMMALLAIPLLLRHAADLSRTFRRTAATIASASVVIQVASILMPAWTEYRQMITLGHPTFVIALRFLNVIRLMAEKMRAVTLSSSIGPPPPSAQSLYLYPFLMMHRLTHLPSWAPPALVAVWLVLIILMAVLLWRLSALLGSEQRDTETMPCQVVKNPDPSGELAATAGAPSQRASQRSPSFQNRARV